MGQTIEPVADWMICNDLSDMYGSTVHFSFFAYPGIETPSPVVHRYNILTGDPRVVTGSYNCYFDKAVCAPLPCDIDAVWDELTW